MRFIRDFMRRETREVRSKICRCIMRLDYVADSHIRMRAMIFSILPWAEMELCRELQGRCREAEFKIAMRTAREIACGKKSRCNPNIPVAITKCESDPIDNCPKKVGR